MIKAILDEMNLENGSNYKKEVLKKHLDNKLFQRVVSMALDKVKYTFGVTMLNVHAGPSKGTHDLEWGLDNLLPLTTREITGNAAIAHIESILEAMNERDREIIEKILDRDLKINFGKTLFNKALDKEFKIIKPPYMRCDIGTDKNIQKNIDFNKKVFSQIKMDGTYRACTVDSDNITIMSRSGQEDSFPVIEKQLKTLNIDGYTLLGEMTLRGEKDRSKGNGLINSDNPPHEDIIFTVWDMIPASEYSMDKDQIKAATKAGTLSTYGDRLALLEKTLENFDLENVKLIEYREIKSMKEAYLHFQEITERGDEGTVIKTEDMTWKDGTSKQQLKVKLVISAEVRVTGFIEGKKGTKREKTFGSLLFENDEGTVKGSTSGFSDEQLEEINNNRDAWIGKVIEVQFNNITKSKNSETYAFSHPRFIADRSNEKNSTDTLERCFEMKEMAMNLC